MTVAFQLNLLINTLNAIIYYILIIRKELIHIPTFFCLYFWKI